MGKGLAAQGIIDDYREQLFFAIIAEPSIAKDLVRLADTDILIKLRNSLVNLKARKIDGKEAQVGQVLGLRIGAVADKLTEVIDERGD
jgi:hypothetical protein